MEIIDRESAKAWIEGMNSLRSLTRVKIDSKIWDLKKNLYFIDSSFVATRNRLQEAIGYLISERDKL